MKTKISRIVAIFLTLAMCFSSLGTTVAGELVDNEEVNKLPVNEAETITAFDTLNEDVAAQSVTLGTVITDLNLPEELDAMDGMGVALTLTGITWESTPEYAGDTASTYTFAAVLPEGYALDLSVEPPTINVTVEPATKEPEEPTTEESEESTIKEPEEPARDDTMGTDRKGVVNTLGVGLLNLSGGGTKTDPYIIETAVELNEMRNDLAAYYKLGNDIDLTEYLSEGNPGYNDGAGWKPIGTYSGIFTGGLDGAGYRITGLWIKRPSEDYVGLFGYTLSADFKNLGVKIGVIGITGAAYVGGLVGRFSGSIESSYVTGGINGNECTGGLVGYQLGTITNSYAIGDVNGTVYAGGLVGLKYGNLYNSYAAGEVIGSDYPGGLVGYQYGGLTTACYFDTESTGRTNGVGLGDDGGVTGVMTENMRKQSTFLGWDFNTVWKIDEGNDYPRLKWELIVSNAPTITTTTLSSGMVGTAYSQILTVTCDITFTLSIESGDLPEGLSFNAKTGEISGLPLVAGTFDLAIKAENNIGSDIVNLSIVIEAAWQDGSGTAADPYVIASAAELDAIRYNMSAHYKLVNDIDLTDYLALGGTGYAKWGNSGWEPIGVAVVGKSFTGSLSGNGYKIIGLWINRSIELVGLFGYIGNSVVNNLGIEIGEKGIIGSTNGAGALTGYQLNSSVINCYATGTVTGNTVGGLVGTLNRGSIVNCYAAVTVDGSSNAGGMVGLQSFDSSIANCYAVGAVRGTGDVGALVGRRNSGSSTDCFFDTQTTGLLNGVGNDANASGVTGKNTAEMMKQATFTEWNFNYVWFIDEDVDYPRFSWELTGGYAGVIPAIMTTDLADGKGKKAYSQMLVAIGDCPITWSVGSGDWPAGLSLDATTGEISGTPTESGTFNFTVNASNTSGTGFKQMSIYIMPGQVGSGTVDDPYIITTAEELDELRNDLTAHYKLGNDIDLSAYLAEGGQGYLKWGDSGWAPIGRYYSDDFSGSLDGDGFQITGLWIKRDNDYVGLFGGVLNAVIKDLVVKLGTEGISGLSDVGGLAGGQRGGSIEGCYTSGAVNATGSAGGLVGYQYSGSIKNCYTLGTINGGGSLGGLVGYQNGGSILNSYAVGNVNGTGNYVGGLVGFQYHDGSIESSYATGDVIGENIVGGLVGVYFGSITNCYASGSVKGVNKVGGLGGQQEGGYLKYSYANGKVSGDTNVGGLLGHFIRIDIGSSFFDTETTGQQLGVGSNSTQVVYPKNTAEMMRQNTFTYWDFDDVWCISEGSSYPTLRWQIADSGSGTTADPYIITTPAQLDNMRMRLHSNFKLGNNIDLSGYLSEGGLGYEKWGTSGWEPIGKFDNETFEEIPFRGSLDGAGYVVTGLWIDRAWNQSYVGLFGYTMNTAIKNLGLEISDKGVSGSSRVGGLVGCQSDNNSSITNCYVTGAVTGTLSYIGALVGRQQGGSIENCYTTGTVSGIGSLGYNVGGLVGYQSDGSILKSYTASTVTGTEIGALVGVQSSGSITDCFFNSTVNAELNGVGNNANAAGVTGLMTVQMIADDTLTGNGAMSALGAINWSKRTAGDDYYYYPELTVFYGGTDEQNAISEKSVRVVKANQTIEAIDPPSEFTSGQFLTLIKPKVNAGTEMIIEEGWQLLMTGQTQWEIYNGQILTVSYNNSSLRYYATNDNGYTAYSNIVEIKVNKAAGAEVDIPTVSEVTKESITVDDVAAPGTGQVVGYAISMNSNDDPSTLTWQTGTTFTGLSEYTDYYIYARSIENTEYNAGTASVSESIRTADETPPTGVITIKNKEFTSFRNTITFKLFFKNMVDVIITGSDTGSDVGKIEYQIVKSSSDYDENGAWITYSGSVSVPANEKGILYAKIIDNAGNFTIINSDGIVVYTDSILTTTGITYVKTTGSSATANVELNSNTVREIKNDEEILTEDTDYTVAMNGDITFSGAYLETLEAGQYDLIISYNPMGESYVADDDNEAPNVSTITLNVEKASQTISGLSDMTKIYGDTSFTITPTVLGNPELTFESGDPDIATIDANGKIIIIGAGATVITVRAAETADYKAAEATFGLTVNKAANTITNISDINKTYGDLPFTLEAQANEDPTFSFTSSDMAVAGVDYTTGVVTINGKGTTTITVTAAATANYAETSSDCVVTVAKAEQILTGLQDLIKINGQAAFAVIPGTNASAENPRISFESSDVAVIDFDTNENFVIMGVGVATITVKAEATINYNMATVTFEIRVLADTEDLQDITDVAQELIDDLEPEKIGDGDGQYPKEAIDKLQEVIDTSKEVAGDPNATQEEVDAAKEALQKAIEDFQNSLIVVDFTKLDDAIANGKKLLKGTYTNTTWAALQTALTAGQALRKRANQTQAEVDAAAQAINDAIALLSNEYKFISAFATFTGSGDLSGTIDAPYSDFVRLFISGVEMDSKNYTVIEGSTVIILKEAYLKTLKNGTYTMKAEFANGYAETTLRVAVTSVQTSESTSASTGDSGRIQTGILLMIISFGVLCVLWSIGKKRKKRI